MDAGRTVLAPNAELAAALFDAVESSHRDAGRSVWPTPRVRDFNSWLREIQNHRQMVDEHALRTLSEFEEREVWRGVIIDSNHADALLEPAGAVMAARRARRTMLDYGIPPAAVAAHGTEEAEALCDWIGRFTRRCGALGCISGDELLERLTAPPEPIAWIENPAWRPMARRWLIQHAGTPLHPVPAAEHAALAVFDAQGPDEEIAAIADWARDSLAAAPGFRAWICVPDLDARRDAVVDAFDATLATQRFAPAAPDGVAAYAIGGGTALADYAPVRAALDVLALADGVVQFERFSAVLRAPAYQASPTDAAQAARLDLVLRRRAPSELRLADWLALSRRLIREQGLAAVAVLDRLSAAAATLGELHGAHPLSRWVPHWIGAFERGPWVHRHRWSSTEFQAAERFRELLAALATADRVFGSHSRPSADRLLATATRDALFQPQTGVAPVWISGECIDPWLRYDGLWVAGLSEERWPAPTEPIALLPIAVQRRYAVAGADAKSQLESARDLQMRWPMRARQLVFSFAGAEASRPAAPSPLLPMGLPALRRAPAQPKPHWFAAVRKAPVFEQLVDERAPPFGATERTRGVATLRSQSRCAFRGYAETRLDSGRLELPAPGFNQAERGTLVHRSLESIWRALGSSAALAAAGEARLAELIDVSVREAIDITCGERDPGDRWRMRERDRLRELLRRWLEVEMRREPFSVERLERGSETARYAGIEFTCRIDRVDRLADGARVLIDYKTGAVKPDWRGERPDNPQLPIYGLLCAPGLVAVAYGRVNAGGMGFIEESERTAVFAPGRNASKLEGFAGFSELLAAWHERIERLAAEFKSGAAQVAPTAQACRSCHLQILCRITEGSR